MCMCAESVADGNSHNDEIGDPKYLAEISKQCEEDLMAGCWIRVTPKKQWSISKCIRHYGILLPRHRCGGVR